MNDLPNTPESPSDDKQEKQPSSPVGKLHHPKPPALPPTVNDLLAGRITQARKTLNDHVDDIHQRLWNDPKYQTLLDAVYDEQAVEGSQSADNFLAAQRIRDWAVKNGNTYVQQQKLASIVKALNVVLRRYGISRKQRRNMVAGEIVPDQENGE